MALRFATPGRRLCVLYASSLRHISAGLREFSTNDDNPSTHEEDDDQLITQVRHVPSASACEQLLGQTDRRLPLPGHVGLAEHIAPSIPVSTPRPVPSPHAPRDPTAEFFEDRHLSALVTYLSPLPELHDSAGVRRDALQLAAGAQLQIAVHACPHLLKFEFAPLFTERDITAGDLSVLVVSQKTDNDMTSWNESVERERAELATHFLCVAKHVSLHLRRLGFWADLIDPRSGRPHLSSFLPPQRPPFNSPRTPAALLDDRIDVQALEEDGDRLLETDRRLSSLGFHIDDLGCCKVIQHAAWGSHVFIGCLFTDAPADDPRLTDILQRFHQMSNL